MKILHVTKKYPNALGGDSVVVSNLQKYQESSGHHVTILTSNCQEIKRGPSIYKFGLADTPAALDQITIRRLLSLIGLFFKAFAVYSKERPDVIHTHSIDMAFFVSFAARLHRVPMIHTFHVVTFHDPNLSAFRRKTELWLARAAGLQIITAPNVEDVAALNIAGLPQATLLPNGVDLNFWQPEAGAVKSKEFIFVSTGRLESQKGYKYLIRAAYLLANTSKQKFQIIIVGEGRQNKPLQKLAKTHGVDNIIKFAGRKTPKQVRSLLSKADAAIFASLYETTPLTLLEAWAVGVPVISTPVGILRGAREGTSEVYLVPPKDAQSLADTMGACMSNKAKREKVAAAGRKEVQKYAWPDITQITETLYGSVA